MVGFAAMNRWVHDFTGVNWMLYALTDWLGLVPLAVVAGFGILGLCQWVHRRSLRKVDRNILVLGGFYGVVLGAFVLFEKLVINYRPVLIAGVLEASYPSSTTMLALCVMPTAAMQLWARLPKGLLRRLLTAGILGFTVFMVVGRLLSGVHWVSDIIGGILLSGGLVMCYQALAE
jgi:undecaprenyl-diphosphatase